LDADLQKVRTYLEQGLDRHLKRLQTLLRQPSVSVTGEGCEACARLYADLSRDAGFPEVELIGTPGYPGVWAAYDVGAPVTCVIYGMLDVRLANPTGWSVAPFSADVLELKPFGRVVVARGAHAVKGPIGVFLNAIEACKKVLGKPPVNVLMISEVDEILAHRPDLGTLTTQAVELRTHIGSVRSGRSPGPTTLTAAELRLLTFLPTHLSFREIGARLFVSPNTVKTQAISVYRKLGVSTRSDAVQAARALRLLEP